MEGTLSLDIGTGGGISTLDVDAATFGDGLSTASSLMLTLCADWPVVGDIAPPPMLGRGGGGDDGGNLKSFVMVPVRRLDGFPARMAEVVPPGVVGEVGSEPSSAD